MSTQQTHERHIGDTRVPVAATLKRPNGTAVDLTGLTVTFSMYTIAGVAKVNGQAATVTDATAGSVQYDFASGDVDTAGEFYGYFIVTESGETDHYPAIAKHLKIIIHSHV